MFCNKCGNKLSDGALFCEKCGNRIRDLSEQSQFSSQARNTSPQSGCGNGFTDKPYNQPTYSYNQNAGYAPRKVLSMKRRDFFAATKDLSLIKMRKALMILSIVIMILCVVSLFVGANMCNEVNQKKAITIMLTTYVIGSLTPLLLTAFGLYYLNHGFYIGTVASILLVSITAPQSLFPGNGYAIFIFMLMTYAVAIAALVLSLKMNKRFKMEFLSRSQQLQK